MGVFVIAGCLNMCVRCRISYNRLKSDLRDVQNEAERIRLQPAFVV